MQGAISLTTSTGVELLDHAARHSTAWTAAAAAAPASAARSPGVELLAHAAEEEERGGPDVPPHRRAQSGRAQQARGEKGGGAEELRRWRGRGARGGRGGEPDGWAGRQLQWWQSQPQAGLEGAYSASKHECARGTCSSVSVQPPAASREALTGNRLLQISRSVMVHGLYTKGGKKR